MILHSDLKSCILSISEAFLLGTFNNVTNVSGTCNECQVLVGSINCYHCSFECWSNAIL